MAGGLNPPTARGVWLVTLFCAIVRYTIHYPLFVGGFKITQFQLDGQQTFEFTVEKKQIDIIVVAVKLDSFLSGNE